MTFTPGPLRVFITVPQYRVVQRPVPSPFVAEIDVNRYGNWGTGALTIRSELRNADGTINSTAQLALTATQSSGVLQHIPHRPLTGDTVQWRFGLIGPHGGAIDQKSFTLRLVTQAP